MGRTSDARERLIESAIELIGTRSYNAVGVQELCDSAGVNKGSFYHFFSSKKELAIEALDQMWSSFRKEILQPILDSELPPMEKFRTISQIVHEDQFSAKKQTGFCTGCHIGNLAVELSTQDEEIRKKTEHIFKDWIGCFKFMIDQAVNSGDLPSDTDAASTAEAMVAYLEGMMLLGKTFNDPSILHRLGKGITTLIITQNGSNP